MRTAPAPERWAAAMPWLLLALALALRLAWLPLRPPHSDEGVNGWFAQRVLSEGFYHYDPENYHGPLHYYLLALAQLLLGRNLWALRLPTVLFGSFAVWLVARCADALGRRVAWTAALFLAVSPAMILYARWAIHESEFLFFSILVLRGLLRWRLRGGELALWQVALGVGGALLTKEVWIVHALALVLAWVCWRLTRRWSGQERAPLPRLPWGEVAFVAAICLAVGGLFYAGFGHDVGGLRRFLAPYAIWSHRAMQGAGHEKPWHYWLVLFARFEPPALAGLVAAPFAAFLAPPALRLLAFYGGGSFAAYTIIHYKTPWCILEIIWPFAFLAAWALWRLTPASRQVWGGLVTAVLTVASLVPAVRINYFRYGDPRQPYIYVQTYPGGLVPLHLLEAAARRDPSLHDAPINVVMSLSWPLPWLLGDFHRVAHWNGNQLPELADATVLFVDRTHQHAIEARLRRRYYRIPFLLSPVHPVSYAYFDVDRFAGKLPGGTRVFTPAPTSPPATTR